MNIFRLAGDLSHVAAILILLVKIWKTKSCSGISGKSQILYAVVFTTRYLDLFFVVISPYNSVMKVIFIASSYGTLYLIYVKFKDTYDRSHDIFKIEYLLIPVACLALLCNYAFTIIEISWAFSIYLESVALLPQLFLISKTGEAESIISHYLFALGSYRGLYILNWIYRYNHEGHYDFIAVGSGIIGLLVVVNVILSTFYFAGQKTEDEKQSMPNSEKAPGNAVVGTDDIFVIRITDTDKLVLSE